MSWDAVAAMGGWAFVVVTISIYLHGRRSGVIEELRRKIDDDAGRATASHEALRIQLNDMMRTFADNYVRQSDMRTVLRGLNEQITETRKDIGTVGNRIDELFKNVQWRG